MLPAEVTRDLFVVAELVNAAHSGGDGIDLRLIDDIRRRYGMTYRRPVTAHDRDQIAALALRFRSIFGASVDELARIANAELADLSFSPRIFNHEEGYGWHIHFFGDDFDLAERLRSTSAMSVMSLIIHGETQRLKCCSAEDCHNVFIDTTKNLSKIYCDPKTCGNRTHVAAFRARA